MPTEAMAPHARLEPPLMLELDIGHPLERLYHVKRAAIARESHRVVVLLHVLRLEDGCTEHRQQPAGEAAQPPERPADGGSMIIQLLWCASPRSVISAESTAILRQDLTG